MPESEWRAPCYKGRRNACRRKRAAAAAAEAERSRSDDKTYEREKSKETIRPAVNPYGDVTTSGPMERIFGKGFRNRTRRNGSRKMPRRSKRTATRRRRH